VRKILVQREAWMRRAACRGQETEAFFPPRGGDVSGPKAVCAACPVRQECLEYALDNRDKFGVWGGLTEMERREIRRERKREMAS
jgi:WhiB family transcriptional regulator, redox-sensing transcriptional regulator